MFKKIDGDIVVKASLACLSSFAIIVTILIVYLLVAESIPFFKIVSFKEFLFGTSWQPLIYPKTFGVLPLVCGSFMIVFGAAFFAIPIGLLTSIYLAEFASFKWRSILKPALEILAGIPTVVYGYFALTFITPLLKKVIPDIEVFNALSASIVVGIMILPLISSLCDDAFLSVPKTLKFGAYALGATSFEVFTSVMIPYAAPRIIASFILACSRALGETMAVTLAAGATPQMSLNPLQSIQTMTAYIIQITMGDTPAGGIEYLTCFGVGLLLFLITLFFNILGNLILRENRNEQF